MTRPTTRDDRHATVPPDDERCECMIDIRDGATIQRIGQFKTGRCRKRRTCILVSAPHGRKMFCSTHARIALEGMVSPEGFILRDTDRANIRRTGTRPNYKDVWGKLETRHPLRPPTPEENR